MSDRSAESPRRDDTVHAARDEYQQAWSANDRPHLSTFLERYPNQDRSALLRELLPLEIELRRHAGEAPTAEEYHVLFPEDGEVVDELFFTAPTLAVETEWTSPSRPDPAANLIGSFGDYDLLEVVGQGGMGVVYKARQRSLNRIVAIKTIRSGGEANEEELARFQTEAEAVAQLEHPNVVPLYEVGEFAGRRYLSMGFVDGPTLSDLLRKGPLEPGRAAELGRSIAEAVAYAHAKGIVHRDLKPGNVLLDADGQPRVTDFGLAKQLGSDSGVTITNQVVGTPSFMPPEQALGREIGPPADVYSLGALLYCLVAGRPPFQAATAVETLRQVVENEPVSPRRLNPALGRDFETILLRCLAKDPAGRYDSAKDVAEELGRLLDGRPIQARPVGALEQFARWCRRRPGLAATSIGAVLATVVCIVTLIVAVVRIRAARDDALEIARRNGHLLTVFELERETRAAANQRQLDELRRRHSITLSELALASQTGDDADLRDDSRFALVHEAIEEIVSRHPGTVAAALSGDGRRLATGELTGAVRVWSLDPLEELDWTTLGGGAVHRIRFGSDDATVHVVMVDETEHDWTPMPNESGEPRP